MSEVLQKLENIQTILTAFRIEQEQIILKSAAEERALRPNPSRVAFIKPIGLDDSNSNTDNLSLIESNLGRVINQEAILMPVAPDLSSLTSQQRLWQQALLAVRNGNTVRIGSIESHGSLWRLLPRKDNFPGIRVMLQTAEQGEEPMFLTALLTLSESRSQAAIWNIRIGEITQSDLESKYETKGVSIGLELIEDESVDLVTSSSRDRKAGQGFLAGIGQSNIRSSRMLISEFDIVSNTYNLSLSVISEDDAEIKEANTSSLPLVKKMILWEICPETWINDELSFLDKYLT